MKGHDRGRAGAPEKLKYKVSEGKSQGKEGTGGEKKHLKDHTRTSNIQQTYDEEKEGAL